MSEENKALVRRWFAELDKGNWQIVDDLIAVDYIDHNPPLPDMAPGREGVKQANALLRAAFPDVRHTVEDQIAEGDKVVTRTVCSATHTSTFQGIPATGRHVSVAEIQITRMKDGKVAERWSLLDVPSLLKQIGVNRIPG